MDGKKSKTTIKGGDVWGPQIPPHKNYENTRVIICGLHRALAGSAKNWGGGDKLTKWESIKSLGG